MLWRLSCGPGAPSGRILPLAQSPHSAAWRPLISHQRPRMRWCSPALLNIAMMCEIAEGPSDPWAAQRVVTVSFLRLIDEGKFKDLQSSRE